jgi:hypothetical protein
VCGCPAPCAVAQRHVRRPSAVCGCPAPCAVAQRHVRRPSAMCGGPAPCAAQSRPRYRRAKSCRTALGRANKQTKRPKQRTNKQTPTERSGCAGLSVTSAYSGRPQVLEYCGGGTLEAFAVDSAEQRELARGYAPPALHCPPARPTAASQPTRAQSATRAKAHMKRARTRQPCVRARGTHA